MIKVGIIGYGGMAGYHHSNYSRTGCMEAVAVYDIDPERVKAGEEKGLKGFSTLEDFLNSHLFELVLVATPNNFHRDMTVAALEAGYHVVCEKPVAMNAAELEEMIAAATAVNAHDFIMKMEKGYDTELKEHGAGLSIGQRQLIAFARTMVSMPKILILDEATSSIDTHTEILVQKGIEALLSGRTSFVIAHRLSTIQNADRIFVIDNGGILEQGSPAELMKKQGAYYNLYMAQFAGIQ